MENNGWIDSDGFFEKEACSVLISGPNGKITGIVIFDVTDGSTFYIANPGGYSAAIQSTGNQNINYPRLIYNGGPGQSSGDIPGDVYSVIVKNGTHLTLSESVTLVDRHKTSGMPDPTFKVEGGATLDTGNYIITADKFNNQSKAKFVLDPGATIRTSNVNGISSVKSGNKITNGTIQTSFATYSSEANYVYYGNTTNQFSGCFVTTPADPPGTYKVHDFIIENPNGLTLCQNFTPLTVTGHFQGTVNGGPGYVSHQPTNPPSPSP